MQEFLTDMISFFKTIIPVRMEAEWGACFAIVGTICSHLFGSWSNLWEAILLLMVLDYITGLLSAWLNPNKKLDSRKGWRGLAKKAVIVIIIMVAHTADIVFNQGTITRDIAIMFYIANEGLSILENATNCGVPVPTKLKNNLAQYAKQKTTIRSNKEK